MNDATFTLNRRGAMWGGLFCATAPAFARPTPSPAIALYEQASGGHVGFYAENTRTGRSLTWRADERFVMCSTFKATLAALILRRIERHEDYLDDRIRYSTADIKDWYAPIAKANVDKGFMTVGDMCAAAVQHSDNTCASLLLGRVGGPRAITAFWRSIGDHTSRLDDPEPYLNRTPPGGIRNTTTPRAMANTFRKLALGTTLNPAGRAVFTDWLIGNRTGDDRLRAGLPNSWRTGDKTGNNGKDAAGDVAITWSSQELPIIIAVYTRGGSPTDEQVDRVFKELGKTAADALT